MTYKNLFKGLVAAITTSIIAIIVVINIGLKTDVVVFGADKFTIWLMIFVIGIVTSIISEVASDASSKEVLFDAMVAAIVATVVINDDLSWMAINEPIETGVYLFKINLWVAVISALSSPAVKWGDKMMERKIGKSE